MGHRSHLRSYSFLFLLFLFVSYFSTAAAGTVGVDYGRDGNNLMPPAQVVELLKANGIGAVSIYDADAGVISAFRNSGIKMVVALPNEKLADAARNPDIAGTWVWESIGVHYPGTQISAVAVGNEVFHQRPDLTQYLIPAMWNVYNAINNLGYAGAIKVSSPVAYSAVDPSFPPSQGSFRGDLQPVVWQMLDFIRRTGSYFMVNLYPAITYNDNYPNINIDYALGLSNAGVRDPVTGLMYYSLLDAQLDALYSAIAALGFGDTAIPASTAEGSLKQTVTLAAVKETGIGTPPRRPPGAGAWRPASPSERRAALEMPRGSTTRAAGGLLNASDPIESVENAQAYNNNLVQRILSGRAGTPLHPEADLDVYIFSLFNENLKPGPESERNYGIFYPDGTKKYDVNFRAGGESWCVADAAAGSQRMQAALDWACGPGGADCGPIQPGAWCYEPNTVEAHASWAMNSYYQRHGRAAGTCDFAGVGRVVYQRPRIGNCDFPSS